MSGGCSSNTVIPVQGGIDNISRANWLVILAISANLALTERVTEEDTQCQPQASTYMCTCVHKHFYTLVLVHMCEYTYIYMEKEKKERQ